MAVEISNIYEPEIEIVKRIKPLFHDELMFSKDTAHTLDAELLESYPEKDRLACVVELMGYKPHDHNKAGRSARVDLTWRVTVVSPSELYNGVSGDTLVSLISRLIAGSDHCGGVFMLIPDVSQGHTPKFDTSLTAIHATFSYEVIIRPFSDK